jgi:hypothetical protein
VVIDESQWLTRECFEYVRHLHDDPDTQFSLLFVGGAGCSEVLRREPMLDASARKWRGREPDETDSGAQRAADVREDILDLFPDRGEDQDHHDGDQHQDQGVLDHTLSLFTVGEAAIEWTARHLAKADVRRCEPGHEVLPATLRVHHSNGNGAPCSDP